MQKTYFAGLVLLFLIQIDLIHAQNHPFDFSYPEQERKERLLKAFESEKQDFLCDSAILQVLFRKAQYLLYTYDGYIGYRSALALVEQTEIDELEHLFLLCKDIALAVKDSNLLNAIFHDMFLFYDTYGDSAVSSKYLSASQTLNKTHELKLVSPLKYTLEERMATVDTILKNLPRDIRGPILLGMLQERLILNYTLGWFGEEEPYELGKNIFLVGLQLFQKKKWKLKGNS